MWGKSFAQPRPRWEIISSGLLPLRHFCPGCFCKSPSSEGYRQYQRHIWFKIRHRGFRNRMDNEQRKCKTPANSEPTSWHYHRTHVIWSLATTETCSIYHTATYRPLPSQRISISISAKLRHPNANVAQEGKR